MRTIIGSPVENGSVSDDTDQSGGNPTPENNGLVGGHLVALDLLLSTNIEDLERLTSYRLKDGV